MPWIKFPNQINNLLKLRRALHLASSMPANHLRDDGIYGEALLNAGVITTRKSRTQLAQLPNSRQPHRTSARGLREMFILLGCMNPVGNRVRVAASGRLIAQSTGQVLATTERTTWIRLLSQLQFPHPRYPNLAAGVISVRPLFITLAMLDGGPLPAQGLAFAFSVATESRADIQKARSLARRLTRASENRLARSVGTTVSELRNNAKVFPGILEQLGLIRRAGGVAHITPAGQAILASVTVRVGTSRRRTRPASRPVNTTANVAWAPPPVDPNDVVERRQLRLVKAERANSNHRDAVACMNAWLVANNFRTAESDYDILARKGQIRVLIEVKSITPSNTRSQIIKAIGQLAFYAAVSAPRTSANTESYRMVFFDCRPNDAQGMQTLTDEEIKVAWVETGQVVFADTRFRHRLEA